MNLQRNSNIICHRTCETCHVSLFISSKPKDENYTSNVHSVCDLWLYATTLHYVASQQYRLEYHGLQSRMNVFISNQ